MNGVGLIRACRLHPGLSLRGRVENRLQLSFTHQLIILFVRAQEDDDLGALTQDRTKTGAF